LLVLWARVVILGSRDRIEDDFALEKWDFLVYQRTTSQTARLASAEEL